VSLASIAIIASPPISERYFKVLFSFIAPFIDVLCGNFLGSPLVSAISIGSPIIFSIFFVFSFYKHLLLKNLKESIVFWVLDAL
jgi:hypothetical protein